MKSFNYLYVLSYYMATPSKRRGRPLGHRKPERRVALKRFEFYASEESWNQFLKLKVDLASRFKTQGELFAFVLQSFLDANRPRITPSDLAVANTFGGRERP